MNKRQEQLLELAIIYWESGRQIPVDLFIQMTEEGLDANTLQEEYL
jgi:hypothetical protein